MCDIKNTRDDRVVPQTSNQPTMAFGNFYADVQGTPNKHHTAPSSSRAATAASSGPGKTLATKKVVRSTSLMLPV